MNLCNSQQVVESLFRREPTTRAGESPPPRPEHKRVWASLIKGKAAVIGEVAAEVLRRDPQGHKIHVALTDGERALQILVSKNLQVTLILDLLHVLEKLWKAAYVFHAEGSTEAEQWVRLRAEKILEGHVSQVVQGIRQMVTKLALGGSKGKMLSSVANYLYRNRSRMHYDQYLARGLPIASGSVEGACKNLIKDRMERSGMRWTEPMAEAVVQLRAVFLSGELRSLLAIPHRTRSETSISRRLERRSKVATPLVIVRSPLGSGEGTRRQYLVSLRRLFRDLASQGHPLQLGLILREDFPTPPHPATARSRLPHLRFGDIFNRRIETLATTLQPSTTAQYRVVAAGFLSYLQTDFPQLVDLSQLRRHPHLTGWFSHLSEQDPP